MLTTEWPDIAGRRFASGFARIFWAFLFLGISFRLTWNVGRQQFMIDLLPDFIGYLLLAAGANKLLGLHAKARGIRNLAMVLTFLSLPDAVQYRIDLGQSGTVTYWITATLPLAILISILDIVLVWKLCGLIADMARQAFVTRTERCALARRSYYLFLKLLLLVALGLVFVAPLLIIPAVIAGVALGIVVMCLMMGLMRQAERLCAAGLVVGEMDTLETRSGIGFRLLMLLALVLPVAALVGSIWYYNDWEARRQALDRGGGSSSYDELIDAFWTDVEQDRLDAAYERTTPNLRKRLSREQFEDLVRENPAIRTCRQKNTGAGAGAGSGPLGMGYANRHYLVKNDDGTSTIFAVTARRGEDSLFHREPPPPGVAEITVQRGGQGQRFGAGLLH